MGFFFSTASLSQIVRPKTLAGTRETFTLAGWAKGNGLRDKSTGGEPDTVFRLRAVVAYSDNKDPDEFVADFNPHMTEWQLVTLQFAKKKFKTVSTITVFCEYRNMGTAYFDNISLVSSGIETGLRAADFVVDENVDESSEGYSSSGGGSSEAEKLFRELTDAFGNNLTETAFHSGEFGTMYRSFAYNTDPQNPDGDGNDLVSESDSRGNVTAYDVDPATSRNETVTDRCGSVTKYQYDAAGRISGLKQGAVGTNVANEATASYKYNGSDNLTMIERGDGMKYNLAYTPFQQLASIGIENHGSLVSYSYKDGNGRLKEISYANGAKMTAKYNSRGQMFVETWTQGGTEVAKYRYTYDSENNLVNTLDILGEMEYNYIYQEGRVARATEYEVSLDANELVTGRTAVSTIWYSYDRDGKLTKKTVEAGGASTEYKFSHGDESVTTTLPTGAVTNARSDKFGRRVFDELRLGTGLFSRRFEYFDGQTPQNHAQNGKIVSSPTTNLVSKMTYADGRTVEYTYDKEERITKIVDSVDGIRDYAYDSLGQLTSEKIGNTTTNITYDKYGNILTKGGVSYGYGLSSANPWRDRLTSYNGQAISYDANGNPTSYRGLNLVWEKGRQLKSAGNNTFKYNSNGIRTHKNGKKYTLDGAKILREEWSGNKIEFLYDHDDAIVGIIFNGNAYYFIKNLQGDVISLANSAGNVVANYSYDAWGRVLSVTGSEAAGIGAVNPIRYRGYYYDTETGWYYLQSRYYDPLVGRFVNADEVEFVVVADDVARHNLYSYCGNGPVMNADFNGFWFDPAILRATVTTTNHWWGQRQKWPNIIIFRLINNLQAFRDHIRELRAISIFAVATFKTESPLIMGASAGAFYATLTDFAKAGKLKEDAERIQKSGKDLTFDVYKRFAWSKIY